MKHIPAFEKQILTTVSDPQHSSPMHLLAAVGDIDGDGRLDYVVSASDGQMVWLQNTDDQQWPARLIDDVQRMGYGGTLSDLTGNGLPDVINGNDRRGDELYWWENSGDWDQRWKRRLIAKTGIFQIHDIVAADITGDGTLSLVFTNRMGAAGTSVFRVPVPINPRVSPWPGIETICVGAAEQDERTIEGGDGPQPEEGLAVGDIDGDGRLELISGTRWFKYVRGRWQAHKFVRGYLATRCAVGDINGDGRDEIVLAESSDTVGGRLAWFEPGRDPTKPWTEHLLAEDLQGARSLAVADLLGNSDIVVGEAGNRNQQQELTGRPPELRVYRNEGSGNFTPHVIDSGTGTDRSIVAITTDSGKYDIVGKPPYGDDRWSVIRWKNTTE